MLVIEFLKASGLLVIPLLACWVIATTVILERFFYWLLFWWRRDEKTRRRIIAGDTRLGRCRDRVAEVLKEYVDNPQDPSFAKVEAERLVRESRRYIKVINWVATLSTSLGLLGTVVGVSMALKDLNDPNKLTPALAVALNTTILGLVIYLVTYSFGSWFSARSTKLASEVKELLSEAKRGQASRQTRPSAPRIRPRQTA